MIKRFFFLDKLHTQLFLNENAQLGLVLEHQLIPITCPA
jgi:hypothetical protein